MSSSVEQIAAGFEPGSEEQWLAAVRSVLLRSTPDAGDDVFQEAFDTRLRHVTEDGIRMEPLYTRQRRGPDPGTPGRAPFVRSTRAAPVPWEIRQRVPAGGDAVAELENGATGLLLEVAADVGVAALGEALDGVYLELAPVSLDAPDTDPGVGPATAMLDLWSAHDVAAGDRTGCLGVDPIGAWARTGGAGDLGRRFDDTAELVRRALAEAPGARPVRVDGTVWHDAGASPGQELAWTTAAAVTTLRELVDRGVDLGDAMGAVEFRWSVDADQFTTIAKLRAARRMWARVAEVAGLPADRGAQRQHAESSRRMMTRYDPWVNALRSTVACFAAAVGGADAITILPHDALTGASALGRRLARNTQSILHSESSLSRVVDPAGGSWYVEHLTDRLATVAWTEVQRVDAAGGLLDAVDSVRTALDDVRAARSVRIATRRQPITGVSEFPNIDEPSPPDHTADGSAAGTTDRSAGDGSRFEPFRLDRTADAFERQRARADRHEHTTGTRPTVHLAVLGSPAVHTPRLTFAQNLFAAGGIRTTVGPPADAGDAAVACLCSSDAVYREEAAGAVADLRAHGVARVLLAGRGLGIDDVDEEVGLGVDVLDVLTRTLDALGVAGADGETEETPR